MANEKTLNPSIGLPLINPLNLQGQQVFNVAQPTDPDDVVTLRYFNANAASTGTAGFHMDYTAMAGTTFDLTGTGLPARQRDFILALDGVILVNGTDYTYVNPTITFTQALKAGSTIEVWNAATEGEQGPRGPQGEIGMTGPQGDQGIQGISGPEGPQGPQGRFTVQLFLAAAMEPPTPIDVTWTAATNALSGANTAGWSLTVPDVPDGQQLWEVENTFDPSTGATRLVVWSSVFQAGSVGPVGPAGPTGAQGPIGMTGPQGERGETGTTGPMGADSTVPGPAGPEGPIGMTGPQGETGDTGPRGPAGTGGTNSDFRWASDIAYVPGALTSNVFSGRQSTGTITVSDQVSVASLTGTPERIRLNPQLVPIGQGEPTSTGTTDLITSRGSSFFQGSTVTIDLNIGGFTFSGRGGFSIIFVQGLQFNMSPQALFLNDADAEEVATFLNTHVTDPSVTFTAISDVGFVRNVRMVITNIPTPVTTNNFSGFQFGFGGGVSFSSTFVSEQRNSAQVRIQVPVQTGITTAIDERVTLAPNLMGTQTTEILNSFVASFNANTNLQREFTLAEVVSDQVQFDHRGIGDISFTASIVANSGTGRFFIEETVTQGTDSANMFTNPILSLNVGSETMTVNVLAGNTAANIATLIATAINSNSGFTSTVDSTNNRVVNYQTVANAPSSQIVVNVTTQGNSNLANGQFTFTFVNGQVVGQTLELYSALTASTGVEPGSDLTAATTAWRRIGT